MIRITAVLLTFFLFTSPALSRCDNVHIKRQIFGDYGHLITYDEAAKVRRSPGYAEYIKLVSSLVKRNVEDLSECPRKGYKLAIHFVYRRFDQGITADRFEPTPILDRANTDYRLDSPWLTMTIRKSWRTDVVAIFKFDERQIVHDVMDSTTGYVTRIRTRSLPEEEESAAVKEYMAIEVLRDKGQAGMRQNAFDARYTTDLRWLLKHAGSGRELFGVFFDSQTNDLIRSGVPAYGHISACLFKKRLSSRDKLISYRSLQDAACT